MPQTPFEPQRDELSGYRLFLGIQRAALLEKLDGLTDEQATTKPTVSDFCMLTLVKHAAFVERRWMRAIGGLDLTGYWPPADPGEEGRIDPGDDVASIKGLFDGVAFETDRILAGAIDMDTVNDFNLNNRWIFLHLIEELARHAGHADILRETIDGKKGV
jgi:hypothetical protein